MKKIAFALLFVTTAAVAQSTPRSAPSPAPAAMASPAATPAPAASPRAPHNVTQLFQVVILHGTMSGAEATENVPKNVDRAIADVRDFLPFKRYRFIDSGLLRLATGSSGQLTLDGVSNTQYRVNFGVNPRTQSHVHISNFTVQPLTGNVGEQSVGKAVIQTSFEINGGETVVVGSSRLGGGSDALIVLLTALPGR
ncbi:MAG TPA: hypothetical protein VF618_06890 [Thermoanaerobaculia bacterium]